MPSPKSTRIRARTAFGEPLWLDALKTIGVALATLLVMLVVGAGLSLAVVAPWARASFDCSMWCVLERDVRDFLGSGD